MKIKRTLIGITIDEYRYTLSAVAPIYRLLVVWILDSRS